MILSFIVLQTGAKKKQYHNKLIINKLANRFGLLSNYFSHLLSDI